MKNARVYAVGVVAGLLALLLFLHPWGARTRGGTTGPVADGGARKAPRGLRWMRPADDPAPLAPADRGQAAVRGRVLDGLTGAPVAGSEVTLRGPDGEILDEAIAKDDGSFGFGSLAGADTIAARASGYAFFTESLHLRVGLDASALVLPMDPAVKVSGRVLSSASVAIAGATVWVEDEAGAEWDRWPRPASDQVTTDATGGFAIDDAPSGQLVVRAKADGFGEGRFELDGVAPGREKKDVVVRLGARPVIAGRVVGDKGPIAGATVRFESWESDDDSTTESGPDGTFRLDTARTGEGRLFASGPDAAGSADVTAPADGVELKVRTVRSITGRVLDASGAAVAGAKVAAFLGRDDDNPSATSGADGAFTLERVPPERVRLDATADGYGETVLAIGPSDQTIEIRLPQRSPLAGSVIAAGAPFLGDGRVIATPDRRWRTKAVQAPVAAGKFEIRLGPGDWKLVAEAKGFGSSDPVSVSITGDEAPPPVTLTLVAVGTIRGRLVSKEGGPIAGGRVSISGQPPWAPMPHEENARLDFNSDVRSGPDGRFELAVKAGDVKLFVYHPEFRPDLVRATVPAGGAADVGDIELLPGPSASAIFEFSGIGAVIAVDDGKTTCRGILPGSPAERAGILQKDVFLEVDGEPTAGAPLEDIIAHIRGPVGTAVSLTVVRPGNPDPMHFDVIREKIRGPG
jgi:hypothetical protein